MTEPAPRRRTALPVFASSLLVVLMMVWAGSAAYVTDSDDYAYFPPFEPGVNRLDTRHLGAEYLCIAKAIREGRGFADPFRVESGPTAWMPPVLPYFQAGILALCDDDIVILRYVIVTCQTLTLLLTGWLVVRGSVRPWFAAGFFVAFLCYDFHHSFQVTHDTWLILLMLDVLLIGFAMLPEAPTRRSAVVWGAVGGGVAMAGPVLGLVWAVLTALAWPWRWRWRSFVVGVGVAGLVMLPWVVRNYLVFGKVIPVKSNLFYELYQSQILTRDGLVGIDSGFDTHPWAHAGDERDRYVEVGEVKFLDERQDAFLRVLRKSPDDYAVRVWNRLAAATMEFVPMSRAEARKPTSFASVFVDVMHPLPLLAVVVLLVTPRPMHRYEKAAVWVYVAWLLPYVLVSYYARYGFPLIGVKAFLCAAAADRLWYAVRPSPRLPSTEIKPIGKSPLPRTC